MQPEQELRHRAPEHHLHAHISLESKQQRYSVSEQGPSEELYQLVKKILAVSISNLFIGMKGP
jgi:hypothetical protein